MTGWKLFITLTAWAVTVLGCFVLVQHFKIKDQNLQIDQLCQATITLAEIQGAEDGNGFKNGKEYCLFFADYNRGVAIVGEFDEEISYNKKPHLLIMHGIEEKILHTWNKAELCYGYKKIR